MDRIQDMYHKVTTAMEHHSQLERLHRAVLQAYDDRPALEECEVAMSGIRRFLKSCLDSVSITGQPTQKSALLAAKVFSIPELLEEILLPLNARELLSASGVNKVFANTIYSSLVLSNKLALTPDSDAFFYTPFESGVFNYLTLQQDYFGSREDQTNVELRLILQPHHAFPTFGPLSSKMLVCQPPLREMHFNARCCTRRYTRPNTMLADLPTITSDTGITIGQILDLFNELQKSHRYCPYAPEDLHNWDGTTSPKVFFTATLRLRRDDPFILKSRRIEHEKDGARKRKVDFMKPYVRAKRTGETPLYQRHGCVLNIFEALENGTPIPTLAEFQAAE